MVTKTMTFHGSSVPTAALYRSRATGCSSPTAGCRNPSTSVPLVFDRPPALPPGGSPVLVRIGSIRQNRKSPPPLSGRNRDRSDPVSVYDRAVDCVMLTHVQMPEESAPESTLTEQEYRTRLWEAFMANVERGDDVGQRCTRPGTRPDRPRAVGRRSGRDLVDRVGSGPLRGCQAHGYFGLRLPCGLCHACGESAAPTANPSPSRGRPTSSPLWSRNERIRTRSARLAHSGAGYVRCAALGCRTMASIVVRIAVARFV